MIEANNMVEASSINEANGSDRVLWIDVAKCIGIFAIYLGHFGPAIGKLYVFVFQFHLPLFFFLSGAVQIFHQRSFAENLRVVTKRLLLPFFFFGLLFLCVNTVLTHSLSSLGQDLLGLAQGGIRNHFPAGSLWFLTCLWLMSLVFPLIRKWKPVYLLLLILVIRFVTVKVWLPSPLDAPSWWYNLDSAFCYYPYYLLGYLLIRPICAFLKDRRKKMIWIRHAIGIASLVFAGYVFVCQADFILPLYINIPGYDLLGIPLHYLLMILSVIYVSWLLRNVKILARVGQSTLDLCGNENLIKLVLPPLAHMVGLTLPPVEPWAICLYTAVLILIVLFTLIPLERKLEQRIIPFCFTAR